MLAGCTDKSPAWIDKGASYSSAEARALLDRVDTAKLAETPASSGAKMRQDVLAALRNHGSAAMSVADLITKTFPAGTEAVPVYVERATVAGRPAVLIIEAWGPSGSKLSLKRLWVIDAKNGDIIDSAAVR